VKVIKKFQLKKKLLITSDNSNICYDLSEMILKITEWFEKDLKIIIEMKNVNIYGQLKYYAIIYKDEDTFNNRFKDLNINALVPNGGIEIKTIDIDNDKEILFDSKEQLIFAIFEYIIHNPIYL
jgi:hypothetical protein